MQLNERASWGFSTLLLIVFAGMLAWGVLGFIEYLFGAVLVVPLQNADFPPGTQFLHWVVITLSGAVFLAGYALRWRHTPYAMIVVFAMMVALCFVQTFDFMTNESRYVAFVLECITYLVIGTYLLRSKRMQSRFRLSSAAPPEDSGFAAHAKV